MRFLRSSLAVFWAVFMLGGIAALAIVSNADASLLADPSPAQTPPKRSTPAKAKTPVKKPKAAEEPTPDESSEWSASTALEGADRLAALKAFLKKFPSSERLAEARLLIVRTAAELGGASIVSGDIAGAAAHFKVAAAEAPSPVPDELFFETLAKFPANLYFRGGRTEAIEIALDIEKKAAGKADQQLALANFYMMIENGAEAQRIAESVLAFEPASVHAHMALGLAHRMEFRLEDSAAAFAKALELDPSSLAARRGLAEMKRALAKPDEAITLYREILSKEDANSAARTGLILSLFDANKIKEAEAELDKAIEADGGNVLLIGGAAYWYAANKQGEKAVSLALKAIAAEPRYIWSHIALARGYLVQNNFAAAEKALIAARQYGNFPTLDYELAHVKYIAGYYREAAEELAKSFTAKNGEVQTRLGGRVLRQSQDLAELIGFERRASIFAPTAGDSSEDAARMAALLAFRQEISAAEPRTSVLAKTVDDLARGDDKMKVYRQLFAAREMLEKRVALPKVLELAKAAVANVDSGLEAANPSTAVMASELYESRSLAALRGEQVNVPEVPKQVLTSILRGEIEQIYGWALYHSGAADEAVTRLRRAITVLPVDSIWWRTATWRLGGALDKAGKQQEALDNYIRSYRGSKPDVFRYAIIEELYQRVHGNTAGLEVAIGPRPEAPGLNIASASPRPSPLPEAAAQPSPAESALPSPSPVITAAQQNAGRIPTVVPIDRTQPAATPAVEETSPTPLPSPADKPSASPSPPASPSPTPEPSPSPVVTVEPTELPSPPEPSPSATPEATPLNSPSPTQDASPQATPTPEASPTPSEMPAQTPTPAPEEPMASPAATPMSAPSPSLRNETPSPSPVQTPSETVAKTGLDSVSSRESRGLFPPVIVSIPRPQRSVPVVSASPTPSPEDVPIVEPSSTPEVPSVAAISAPSPTPSPTDPAKETEAVPSKETRPTNDMRPRVVVTEPEMLRRCVLTVGDETVNVPAGGGDRAVVVRRADDGTLDGINVRTTSPRDIGIRRIVVDGIRDQAMYAVRSISGKTGVFQVIFEMPCGKREVTVQVR